MSDKQVKVLVTGGAGFVGSWIVKVFARAHPEWTITVLDVVAEKDFIPPVPAVQYTPGDVRQPFEISNAVEWAAPDVIIHLAGWIPQETKRYARRPQDVHNITKINVQGTQNMLDVAKEYGVKAFVYTSSCTVITDDLDRDYPNHDEETAIPPRSLMYGESKVFYPAKLQYHLIDAERYAGKS